MNEPRDNEFRLLSVNVVGMTFSDWKPRAGELEARAQTTKITLHREEGNVYDPNAVRVDAQGPGDAAPTKLGFIPKEMNLILSRLLGDGGYSPHIRVVLRGVQHPYTPSIDIFMQKGTNQ